MHMRVVLIVIFLLVLAVPVQADYEQDKQACINPEVRHDTKISACTRLIQSGRLSKKNLPIALFNRAISYAWTEQNSRSIQGFSEVIRFKPRYADAFYNRGVVYDKMYQSKMAVQYYKKAYDLGSRRPNLLKNSKNMVCCPNQVLAERQPCRW